ncbi:MAG: zinc ribbon domain-containing protein [Lachnospiraceae bacterium]|nr:zinc ribbon domain-containing protein [Lachnospiraceae bacterium]
MRASSESKKYDKAVAFIKDRLADIGTILKLRPADMNESKLLREKEALETVEHIVERRKALSAIRPSRFKGYACPRCGHHFGEDKVYFCPYCGQHISYTDEKSATMTSESMSAHIKCSGRTVDITVDGITVKVLLKDVNELLNMSTEEAEMDTKVIVTKYVEE